MHDLTQKKAVIFLTKNVRLRIGPVAKPLPVGIELIIVLYKLLCSQTVTTMLVEEKFLHILFFYNFLPFLLEKLFHL